MSSRNVALIGSFKPFKIFSCKFRRERLHFPWGSERLNGNRKFKGNTECFLRIKMCFFLISKVLAEEKHPPSLLKQVGHYSSSGFNRPIWVKCYGRKAENRKSKGCNLRMFSLGLLKKNGIILVLTNLYNIIFSVLSRQQSNTYLDKLESWAGKM